ncbi:hypothetical protein RIF29_28978 [Crotalaria pallida]|uniref:Uncharacterized protein n=1 Tax=Crotalaria pallida TaxID=3830 RepID=A0AAN9HX15_CROPI
MIKRNKELGTLNLGVSREKKGNERSGDRKGYDGNEIDERILILPNKYMPIPSSESCPLPSHSSFSVMHPVAKIIFHNFDASVSRELDAATPRVAPYASFSNYRVCTKEGSTSSSHRRDPNAMALDLNRNTHSSFCD